MLQADLLIGVTNFFRDPPAFEALRGALPALLAPAAKEGRQFRVWVPACSTGEEAYSIAMIIQECLAEHDLKIVRPPLIFATDIDKQAVERARNGLYPANISADVTPERLRRFFIKEGNEYRIRKEIRAMIIFAPQNVIGDPPFTKLDLLCCRNLLIYLKAELQKKLIPLFRYALNPGGLLFLGASETVSGPMDLFAAVDTKWKIYRSRDAVVPAPATLDLTSSQPALHDDSPFEAVAKA